MRKWRNESVLDLYNLLLAIFLFVSPWFLARASGTAVVDLKASGAAIALMSLAAIFAYASWQEWANLLLGIWLIVSPWLLGFAHTRAMHYSIGVGVTVAFFSALELWLVYDAAPVKPAAHASPDKK
jgi:hypothetical protein